MHTTNCKNKKSPTDGDDDPRVDAELTPLQRRIVRREAQRWVNAAEAVTEGER